MTEPHDRRRSVGASDSNIIMSGDEGKIEKLRLIKTGELEPDDLSRVLPVQMGIWTEEPNRRWFTLTTGDPVTRAGEVVRDKVRKYMTCTLDGFVASIPATFEAKHVNAFSNIDDVVQQYMPQVHHQMHVCGTYYGILSVFIGTQRYETYQIELDPFYVASLLDRVDEFWHAVQTMKPARPMPIVEPPAVPGKLRSVDMTGNNSWAVNAATWLENREAAAAHASAAKELKSLVQPDVGEAYGHDVRCTRSKSGSLTIKEVK